MELTFQGQNWSDNTKSAQVCYLFLLGAFQVDLNTELYAVLVSNLCLHS